MFRFVVGGAIALVRTFYALRTLVCVFADDARQTAGRYQFCESHSALRLRVVGCTAWLAHSKNVMKWRMGQNVCRYFRSDVGAWLEEMLRMSFCDPVVLFKTHR